jgi:hypothetical protein
VAAATLGSLAPADADGLDWFAGMGQGNVDDFRLLETDETAARAKLDADRETDLATSAAELAGILESLLSPTDAAVLKGELAEYLSYTGHEGLAPGSQGWWDDGKAHASPWGFDLSAISVPIWSCTAGAISSSRSATASGWPRTSPAPRPGCTPRTVTSPCWRTASARSTPG